MRELFRANRHFNDTYTGLSADFGRARSILPVEVGLDWVIKEESVLIEVVLGPNLGHTHGLREWLLGRL